MKKCRAERAAFYLQIRHVERQLLTFLDRKADDDLAEDQLLILSLACHFMDSLADKDLSTSFDRSTVDRVRNKYSLQQRKIQEDCLICQEPIPFDDHVEGHCSNLHKANRCPASLQTCFSDTFSCQWCGTHFHRKSGNIFPFSPPIHFINLLLFVFFFNESICAFSAEEYWPRKISSSNQNFKRQMIQNFFLYSYFLTRK